MPATHWDFVLSCFEPVVTVTGGIGTYTRLLLERLDALELGGRPPKILFLTAETDRGANDLPLANVRTIRVPTSTVIEGLPLNNLPDPFFHYSLNAMWKLLGLQGEGDTFGAVEFPDYNAEAFYTVRARAMGMLRTGRMHVRLQSPLMMLHQDNAVDDVDRIRHRFFAAERYVYHHADVVLFAGDAMRDRVASLLSPEDRAEFLAKCVKVPGPWPKLTTHPRITPTAVAVQIGYVGRLELRKGVDLLVRAGRVALERSGRPAVFHFFGRDTHTFRHSSMRAHLETLVPKEHRKAFVFHDYVPQAELWERHLPGMDLFVFPSRFENYPNVLLETLALDRPILASSRGCMPEMARSFSNVETFDPLNLRAFASVLERRIRAAPEEADSASRYEAEAASVGAALDAAYRSQIGGSQSPALSAPVSLPTIAFVMPHFKHSEWVPALFASIRPQMIPGDELILVDDCSPAPHPERTREHVRAAGGVFLSTAENAGPAVARNLGAVHAHADLLYFVDADDELVDGTVAALRRAFALDPGLEAASGFMRAFNDENHYWASYDPQPGTIFLENSSHCGIVIRREVFARTGGYRADMRNHLEDWEFHARLVTTGVRFEILPLVTYRYRVNKQTGRDASRPGERLASYVTVVRSALEATPPERLGKLWPEVGNLLAQLLRRNAVLEEFAAAPPHLRYRLADSLNLTLKKAQIHRPLKTIVGRAMERK